MVLYGVVASYVEASGPDTSYNCLVYHTNLKLHGSRMLRKVSGPKKNKVKTFGYCITTNTMQDI